MRPRTQKAFIGADRGVSCLPPPSFARALVLCVNVCRVGWRFECVLLRALLFPFQMISGLPPDQKEWLTPTQDLYLESESSEIHQFQVF